MNERWSSTVSTATVVAAFVCLTSGPLFRVRTWWSYEDPLSTDPTIVAVNAAFGALAVGWLASGGRWRALDRRAAVIAGSLLAWIVLGSTWSLDPAETLRQGLQLASSLAVGAAAVVALGGERARLALWAALHIGLGWSVLAISGDRSGTIDRNGDWTGVFFNRNSLALYAALGLLVTGFVAADRAHRVVRRRRLVLELAVLGLAGVADLRVIAGTDALTPLAAFAASAVVVVLVLAARRVVARGVPPGSLIAVAGLVAVAGASLAWASRGRWLDRLGRDSDLTGRSDIWDVSLEWAWRRPIHGFGYLGAWSDAGFLGEIEERRGALVGSAHNAFIEVFLGAGIVGLDLLVCVFALLYLRHAVDAVTSRGPNSSFPLAIVVFVVVENLTETLIVGNQLVVALIGFALVAGPARPPTRSPREPDLERDRAVGSSAPGDVERPREPDQRLYR